MRAYDLRLLADGPVSKAGSLKGTVLGRITWTLPLLSGRADDARSHRLRRTEANLRIGRPSPRSRGRDLRTKSPDKWIGMLLEIYCGGYR